MTTNILISGPPGSGKTTLVKQLMRYLGPLVVRGFFKEEIVENGVCKGYRIMNFNYDEQIIAHVHFEGRDRFGPFGVNVDGFSQFAESNLLFTGGTELFIIDEISSIECLSPLFRKLLAKIFDSDIPLIAVFDPHAHAWFPGLKKRKDTLFMAFSARERESMWKKVLLQLG